MNQEQRGSEKLMASCSGVTALSQAEIEQVAGGEGGIWRAFPHGMPGIELVTQGGLFYNSPLKVDLAQHLGLNVRKPDYLYESPRG